MSEEKQEIQIIKRTFEYTLKNQEDLRDTLMTLIKEDRVLTDKERGEFFTQLSRSTLGMGRDIPYSVELEPNQGKEKLGSVEYMGRFLAMQKETPVSFSRLNSITQKKYNVQVPISKLWEALLYGLFDTFPISLDRSSAMSKEHELTSGGDSFGFESGTP
jgi:hypothetical protein